MPAVDARYATARVDAFLNMVRSEVLRAMVNYPPMNSPHEGYAVILEEVEELWDEVRKKPSEQNHEAMRHEVQQIAAMAVRFAVELVW